MKKKKVESNTCLHEKIQINKKKQASKSDLLFYYPNKYIVDILLECVYIFHVYDHKHFHRMKNNHFQHVFFMPS